MSPFIKEGERVLIGETPGRELHFGDIIALKEGEKIIVHRVIGKSCSQGHHLYFREKGDHNLNGKIVAAGDILGQALIIEKEGRKVNLDKPGWQIINVILAFHSCLIFYLYKVYQKLNVNR